MSSEINFPNNNDEFINYIENHPLKWIVDRSVGYSPDYPSLQLNWKMLCEVKFKTKQQEILLVNKITFDPSDPLYNLCTEACNKLTKLGFCIRFIDDFVKCSKCHLVIPKKRLWSILQQNQNIPCPQNWSRNCINCKEDEKV